MKKLLLLTLLAGCYSGHAQAIKFKPPSEDWRATATPQQMADSLKVHEAKLEKARQQVNLLRALSDISADRVDDSIKQLRAAQIRKWSTVPKTKKRAVYKKSASLK